MWVLRLVTLLPSTGAPLIENDWTVFLKHAVITKAFCRFVCSGFERAWLQRLLKKSEKQSEMD